MLKPHIGWQGSWAVSASRDRLGWTGGIITGMQGRVGWLAEWGGHRVW